MLVSFTFRISMECSACKMSLPVNGVAASIRCYHCGEVNELGAVWWKDVVEPEHLAEALGFAEGEAQESRVMSNHGNYIYAYGKRVPRCQACKGPDLFPEALIAESDDGRAFCPGCGAVIRLRVADDLCRAISPRAVLAVAESIPDAAGQAIQAKRQPVIFACMGCGGGLPVDGAARSVACQYCSASNYLPDGLWNQLNPVPKPHAWFLICDYDDASLRALRWSTPDGRAADAAGGSLGRDDFERLFADPEDDVRTQLAGNPACPPELLARLAVDEDSDVRVAAAGNPHTPIQAMLLLAAGSDDDVWRALCGHAGQDAQVIEQLAQHHRYGARVLAASHPNLSLATLHKLAKDSDRDVGKAATARLQQLRDAGVDVNAGRGLLAKLFG